MGFLLGVSMLSLCEMGEAGLVFAYGIYRARKDVRGGEDFVPEEEVQEEEEKEKEDTQSYSSTTAKEDYSM